MTDTTITIPDDEHPYTDGEIIRHTIHLTTPTGDPIVDISVVEDTGGALDLFVVKHRELMVYGPSCTNPKVLAQFTQPAVPRPRLEFDITELTGDTND